MERVKLFIKKLKIVLIFSIFVSMVCSCLNDIEKRLSKNNNIWLFYEYDNKTNKYKISNYGYKFYKDGTYIPVWYSYFENKWFAYVMNDVVIDNHWSYDKKSNTLNIGTWKMKIIFFDNDTIFLSGSSYYDLWVNCRHVNPKKLKSYFYKVDVNKKIRQMRN